ncbi:YtzC family protein [Bacillus sp. B-jedd]|uniref:YtzC family protein n=1 Tax=Bacillus sp. B-jedd TaxID=1476857 RepID=UPI000515599D|nr:YtzC family protein [Bacillus sp. B-jedd]CEG28272.1 YtzC protein [Bacillus sp. B-jedd]
MATRKSIEDFISKCEQTIEYAQEQYNHTAMQEHYNAKGHTEALQALEDAYNEMTALALSANSQQRERLNRMRLQLQGIQNDLILQRY